ncbi:secreted RxLR effector protein 161-like [Ipomoea triloba]|uniref:secreted RxLR effector protein 161-like n=1 Tax=Ipomoea triloba TaxID=35885 RepID=UPI00125DEF39|nr:secreted RxLR effector protein 161-like [Ipomoea triloba]
MIGELTCFLGLQVKQMETRLFLSQTKYALNLVKRFGLEGEKEAKTPLSTIVKLSKDTVSKQVDGKLYRSMIGSLLYLTSSRRDIRFSVGLCARFQADPKETHINAVKRIIKYVKGTTNHVLWYSRDTGSELLGYSDVDWAGNVKDRKKYFWGLFLHKQKLGLMV